MEQTTEPKTASDVVRDNLHVLIDDDTVFSATTLVQDILQEGGISAASFIVTLYGDVVEPRQGELSMGSMIQLCESAGFSENQVRTAVSRLVRAGQFAGERLGRHSYYRLTPAARSEFNHAAGVIYAPTAQERWQLVYTDGDEALMRSLKRLGYAALNPRLAMGPDTTQLPDSVLVWSIDLERGQAQLPQFLAEHWDLAQYREAYQQFVSRFEPVLPQVTALCGEMALMVRLLLVHQYRQVVLRTPQLPACQGSEQDEGLRARQLFARLYLALSAEADQHIEQVLKNANGSLPIETEASQARLTHLAACLQDT